MLIVYLSLTVPAPGRISSLLKMKSNDFLNQITTSDDENQQGMLI
jgi:hypothetical protein